MPPWPPDSSFYQDKAVGDGQARWGSNDVPFGGVSWVWSVVRPAFRPQGRGREGGSANHL